MAVEWVKTKFLGVRYRHHSTRKHGVQPDRCFSIRYKRNGRDREEVAGWASEGMSAEKAFGLLSIIRENIRQGARPQSLAELREMEGERLREEARAKEKEGRAGMTLSQFWEEEYLPTVRLTKRARTVAEEEGLFRRELKKTLGMLPVGEITPSAVERLIHDALKAGKAPATAVHIRALISQVWNMAVDRGIVTGENPVRRVKIPKKDNRRRRFLTTDEARRLLEALAEKSRDVHDEALLALFAGLRAGEIHALTWGDVNMDAGIICIRDPKNKESRFASITPELFSMLRERYNGQSKSSWIFPASGKEECKRKWTSDTFPRVVEELGLNDGITDALDRVTFHTLRHTFASWLVQRGVPLYTVAQLMGHKDLSMTKRYSHLAPDTMRAAALSLSGLLEKKPAKVLPFFQAKG